MFTATNAKEQDDRIHAVTLVECIVQDRIVDVSARPESIFNTFVNVFFIKRLDHKVFRSLPLLTRLNCSFCRNCIVFRKSRSHFPLLFHVAIEISHLQRLSIQIPSEMMEWLSPIQIPSEMMKCLSPIQIPSILMGIQIPSIMMPDDSPQVGRYYNNGYATFQLL